MTVSELEQRKAGSAAGDLPLLLAIFRSVQFFPPREHHRREIGDVVLNAVTVELVFRESIVCRTARGR
ncbi:hypothetical protein [Bradyrhizobium sp. USDA 3256]